MIISKPILGVVAFVGTAGGGVIAYKLSSSIGKENKVTVEKLLREEGYELIDENKNATEQWKTSFNAFKGDSYFISEINKYAENSEVLTKDDNGDKGKMALEKLCSAYLKEDKSFTNASKWCVLRILDRIKGGNLLPLSDTQGQESENKKNEKMPLTSTKIRYHN